MQLFELADENHAGIYGPDPEDGSRPLRGVIQNFVGITIDGDTLTAVTYEIDQKKNSGKPYIVDQFGIMNASATSTTTSSETYVIVQNDMLWKIAQKFGTTWQKLQEINKLINPNLIFPGQKLRVK